MTVEMKKRKKDEGSPSDEYGTPVWLYNLLDKEFNFKLDVCASVANAKCEAFYDKERNGLIQQWAMDAVAAGGNIFCNPPYSNILPWAVTMRREVWDHGSDLQGAMIVKFDPSTKHGALIMSDADEVRIPTHRIAFEMPGKKLLTANFPIAVPVFRKRRSKKTPAKIHLVDWRDLMPVKRDKQIETVAA